MAIRFYNAKILPLANDEKIIEGELWTEAEKISYVGSAVAPEKRPTFAREIDLKGNLILPGFKNAHTHSAMTYLRSLADDLPLLEWLEQQIFPREAQLQPEDIYWCTQLAILEYLSSGITAAFDMYFFPEQYAKACVDMGFRSVLVSGLNKFGPTLEEQKENYLRFNNYHSLINYHLGFHAEYTCTYEILQGIAKLAEEFQAPVFTHNSETAKEVLECKERYKLTPTQLFDKLGIYNFGGGGYHCVHLDEKDMEIFQARKLTVVSNPASNSKLASGIAPIADLQKRNINIAIGTDGPASNNSLDMFKEMYLLNVLAKLKENDASAVKAESVVRMACSNGARAMGLKNADSLQVGKLADLCILDLKQPNMQPENNIVKNIVYAGNKSNVKLTMINGQIVYEDGNYPLAPDVERIYYEANSVIKRMLS